MGPYHDFALFRGIEERHRSHASSENLFDSRQGGQRLGLQLALVANHADDGAQFSAAQVGTQAKLLDSLQDVIDLRRR